MWNKQEHLGHLSVETRVFVENSYDRKYLIKHYTFIKQSFVTQVYVVYTTRIG